MLFQKRTLICRLAEENPTDFVKKVLAHVGKH
jgi:hypothetical protein